MNVWTDGEAYYCDTCYDAASDADKADMTPVSDYNQRDETGKPHSCDTCLGWVTDENEAWREHPASDDILALTAACGDARLTQLLSGAARLASDYEKYTRWLDFYALVWAADAIAAQPYHTDTLIQALEIIRDWGETWRKREVLKIRHDEDGSWRDYVTADADAAPVTYTSTHGYLDACEMACEACTRVNINEQYETEWGDCYCPDCVEIVD